MDDELSDQLHAALPPPPPSVAELSAVVRRANRSRRRVASVMVSAAALVAALVGVELTSDHAQKPTITSASLSAQLAAEDVSAPPSPGGPGVAAPVRPGGPTFQRLFRRATSDGVDIRAYLVQPSPAFTCSTSRLLLAALSDAGAVSNGISGVPDGHQPTPIHVLGAGGFGQMEGSPATWVAVLLGDQVTRVQAHFEDGHIDEMVPVEHLALLAHAQFDYRATLTAFAADGSVVSTLTFPQPNERPVPPECRSVQAPNAPPASSPSSAPPPTRPAVAPTFPSGRAGPGTTGAQAQPGAPFMAFGTLVSSASNSLTMQVMAPSSLAHQTIVVSVPPGTPIIRNGQPASLSDLRPGDQIGVRLVKEPSGYVAQGVEARSAQPSTGPTPSR